MKYKLSNNKKFLLRVNFFTYVCGRILTHRYKCLMTYFWPIDLIKLLQLLFAQNILERQILKKRLSVKRPVAFRSREKSTYTSIFYVLLNYLWLYWESFHFLVPDLFPKPKPKSWIWFKYYRNITEIHWIRI